MGRKKTADFADRLAKKQVAHLGGSACFDNRCRLVAADNFKRVSDPLWIASKLHGGGIGQILALLANGGFYPVAKKLPQAMTALWSQKNLRYACFITSGCCGGVAA